MRIFERPELVGASVLGILGVWFIITGGSLTVAAPILALVAIVLLGAASNYATIDDERITLTLYLFFKIKIPLRSIRAFKYPYADLPIDPNIAIEFEQNGKSISRYFQILRYGKAESAALIRYAMRINQGIALDDATRKLLEQHPSDDVAK